MTHDVEMRVVAFVRTIANRCSNCLYRREENCSRCDSRAARRLLEEIERDRVPPKDYSLFSRMSRIAEILGRADKPLFSSEINIGDMCSFQLKQWTLKRMMRLGVIGRRLAFKTRTGYCVYRYYVKPKETK